MTNIEEQQLEKILLALLEMISGNNKSTGLLWERFGETTEAVAKNSDVVTHELTRFRAWEALLRLFFARYYSEKPEPMGAAISDRDLLADQRRKVAQDEVGAQEIIKLYDSIFAYIRAGQELTHSRAEGEHEDVVM